MKKIMRWFLLTPLLLIATGCPAQVTVNPTVYTCNGVTTFTPLNASSPATGTEYADINPGAGPFCYIIQSTNGAGGNSAASNVSGPTATTASDPNIIADWKAPTSGVVPAGYILSRAPAIQTSILAPSTLTTTSSTAVAQVQPETKAPEIVLTVRSTR